jgi:acrylyl-CoA reductase (NADPH)
MATFRALVLREESGKVVPRIEAVDEVALPSGEVTVAVECSTLNYKDGMILQGIGRLVRSYPHVPGIDFAGTVERSESSEFAPGDPVILTGWRVGETQWGGYAQKARVRASYLVRRPEGLTARQAMAIGTAGLTAMLAVMALERHGLHPGSGDVLVTGAAGGVGSVAVSLLSRLGYRVVASTGRPEQRDYLTELGAADLIDRASLSPRPSRPLDSERWGGAVDAVGGTTLATILTQLKYRASVAACGLAAGSDLSATVIPFLLRGVNLLGIDSVMCPHDERTEGWARLTRDLPLDRLERMTQTVPLSALPELAPKILKGEIRGRVVVDVAA